MKFLPTTTMALLAAGLFSLSSYSAPVQSSSAQLGSMYKKLVESPLSLTYINEITTRRDRNNPDRLQGVGIMNYTSLSYKMNDQNKVTWANRLDSWNDRGVDEKNTTAWTNSEINYYRSSLLTEAVHGVSATLQVRQRFYPENMFQNDNSDEKKFIGYTRPGVILSKKLSDRWSLTWNTHVAVYNRPSGTTGGSSYYFYTYPTVNYSVSDKWSMGLTNEYINTFKTDGSSSTMVATTAELAYQLHPQVNVGAAVVGTTMESGDDSFFAQDISDKLSFGITTVVRAF